MPESRWLQSGLPVPRWPGRILVAEAVSTGIPSTVYNHCTIPQQHHDLPTLIQHARMHSTFSAKPAFPAHLLVTRFNSGRRFLRQRLKFLQVKPDKMARCANIQNSPLTPVAEPPPLTVTNGQRQCAASSLIGRNQSARRNSTGRNAATTAGCRPPITGSAMPEDPVIGRPLFSPAWHFGQVIYAFSLRRLFESRSPIIFAAFSCFSLLKIVPFRAVHIFPAPEVVALRIALRITVSSASIE